ncbi:hypothetical protein JYP52_23575, partial [Nitratireductor aquibiodomus]|nr:hypothetical protein [Nitratireductor aquibiodomus]
VLLQYAYDLFFGKSVALHLWSFAWGQSLLQTGLIHWGNVISNWSKDPIDAPSSSWLGHFSCRERVRRSGLWNNNHVDESYTPGFLDVLERHVRRTG